MRIDSPNLIGDITAASISNALGDVITIDNNNIIRRRTLSELLTDVGAVPTSRTLTINGESFDLSADRSWNITAGIGGTIADTQVVFGTGSNTIGGDASLAWNNTNKRLSIGGDVIYRTRASKFVFTDETIIPGVAGTLNTGEQIRLRFLNTISRRSFQLRVSVQMNNTGTNTSSNHASWHGIIHGITTETGALIEPRVQVLHQVNFGTTNVELVSTGTNGQIDVLIKNPPSGNKQRWTIEVDSTHSGLLTLVEAVKETVIPIGAGGTTQNTIFPSANITGIATIGSAAIGYTTAPPTNGLIVNGNVGILTNNPVNALSLGDVGSIGQDVNSMYVGANFTGTGINFRKTGNFSQQIHFDTATGDILFKNTSSTGTSGNPISYNTRMLIASNGNVGIGTTSLSSLYRLNVNGNINLQGLIDFGGPSFINRIGQDPDNSSRLLIQSGQFPGELGAIRFLINGTERASIGISGQFIINDLGGAGSGIVGTDASGNLIRYTIGSGLTLTGTTLTASGGSTTGLTGSGTANIISMWSGATSLTNSVISQDATDNRITITNPLNGTARLVVVNNNTGTSAIAFNYAITTGNRYLGFVVGGANRTGTTAGLSNASLAELQSGGDSSAMLIHATGNYPMAFAINQSEVMRINALRRVLINTTSDNGYLAQINGGISLNAKSLISQNAYFVCEAIGYRFNNSTDTFNNVIMYDNGNMFVRNKILVGTTTDNGLGQLQVNGNITASGYYKSGRLGYYGTYNSAQVQGIWSISENFPISIANNNFGSAYGMAYAYSTAGGAPIVNQHQVLFVDEGIWGVSISFTGEIRAKGDIVAFSSSDQRLKDNLVYIENSLEKINKLGGYSFTWNNNQETYTGNDYGVVAQEVEALFPEMVTTRDNGYKAVKYDRLIPVMIEAIKELSKEVKELKGGKK
jgi:hypothetical protein